MRKIKNYKELASTDLREDALFIAEAGLDAIDTKKAILSQVKLNGDFLIVKDNKYKLDNIENIYVAGVGKASADAAEALEEVLGDRLSGGLVIDVREEIKLKKVRVLSGEHPYPTQKNVDYAGELIDFVKTTKENDLLIFIVSGGGSTLLCRPNNFTCIKEAQILDLLFQEGADIKEINTLRKHMSFARGGFIVEYAYPSKVVSLVFSDVLGNDVEFIASGPTIKDDTTVEEAMEIVKKYEIDKECDFDPHTLVETPTEDKFFENVDNILFLSNESALEAMRAKSEELGYEVEIKTLTLKGEAEKNGQRIVNDLGGISSGTVLLYGGETTVTIKGKGNGGRNQELVLSALRFIEDGELILSFASDGLDNGKHAGAIADHLSLKHSEYLKLDIDEYLDNNDSFNFFEKTGDYIDTGDTGSSVMDLVISIKKI